MVVLRGQTGAGMRGRALARLKGEWAERRHGCFAGLLVLLLAVALAGRAAAEDAAKAKRARVGDIVSVEGVRDNQLVGYGIVVGLHGTGDSSQTVFPLQTLESALERMGVSLQGNAMASMMQTRNMAAVFLSGTLPPFVEAGSKVDVTVSSAGDARSLEGGVLLLTPLYGPDGRIYAEAQGPMVLGGYAVSANGSSKSVNYPTTARIPSGAIVERGVALDLSRLRPLTLLLDDADFETAQSVASAIDRGVGRKLAHALDSRRIEIEPRTGEDIAALLAQVEAVEVDVNPQAKVVVNERTGTVVIGGNVTLQPVTILHGGLVVNVVSHFEVVQPNPLAQGTTQVVEQTTLQAQDKAANRIELREGATVEDLVERLQQIGATARDIVSILQAMKEAGALEAELEVL
jgi:flagellar P-ring protein FlgI